MAKHFHKAAVLSVPVPPAGASDQVGPQVSEAGPAWGLCWGHIPQRDRWVGQGPVTPQTPVVPSEDRAV